MHFDRMARAAAALSAVGVLAGCGASTQRSATVESGGDVAMSTAVVTPSDNRAIPAGAQLSATTDQTLGTEVNKVGDVFTATVSQTLRASNGAIVVPAGAKIEGRVTARDDSDHAGDPALLRLAFDRISFDGRSYPFSAEIVQSGPMETTTAEPSNRTKRMVIGGAVGAALGGLISGGELKKIVIGGAIGAAAGSIVSLGTETNASLPAGSYLTVRTTQTTTLR